MAWTPFKDLNWNPLESMGGKDDFFEKPWNQEEFKNQWKDRTFDWGSGLKDAKLKDVAFWAVNPNTSNLAGQIADPGNFYGAREMERWKSGDGPSNRFATSVALAGLVAGGILGAGALGGAGVAGAGSGAGGAAGGSSGAAGGATGGAATPAAGGGGLMSNLFKFGGMLGGQGGGGNEQAGGEQQARWEAIMRQMEANQRRYQGLMGGDYYR